MSLQAVNIVVTPAGDQCNVTIDNKTFNNVAVTTVGDIHVATINSDGVSLLMRYTDANTVAANGTVNGETVSYKSDAVAAYAQTFQIPNSDFEGWAASSGEPDHWHGFKSAKTNWITQLSAGLITLEKSSDVRPGSTGTYSALTTSGAVGSTVANGTFTNGLISALSTTATDKSNHSEMDSTSTSVDKNGDKFYTALYARPDILKTWFKFSQGTINDEYPYATISAIVFDGTYYQDPEDNTYTNVAAKGGNQEITRGDWREIVMPFDYDSYASNHATAEAILITFSTNATPGKGSGGDKIYVDDLELVYNAAISNIALNGVALDGFNFDAATTTYNVTYSGAPMAITADNFVVTADGQSAIVVKNVEDLGNGNYCVTIAVTSPDFKNSALYTINVTKEQEGVRGDLNDDGVVDVSDINIMINMMLGTMAQTAAADLDNNGDVDVSDINELINIML